MTSPLSPSSDLFPKLSPSLKSPAFPLLSTHSCILPTPAFFIVDFTFTCLTLMLSSIQLGNGEQGTDVRVRNNRLHCQNCYSNDEGKLFSFFNFLSNNKNSNDEGKLLLFLQQEKLRRRELLLLFILLLSRSIIFRVEVQQSVIATEEKKIYTRLALS